MCFVIVCESDRRKEEMLCQDQEEDQEEDAREEAPVGE